MQILDANYKTVRTPDVQFDELRNKIEKTKSRGAGFVAALDLCSSTRKAWDTLYSEWLIDQSLTARVPEFTELLNTSVDVLEKLGDRTFLRKDRATHLGRMLLNISYRLKMADALQSADNREEKIAIVQELYRDLKAKHG